jgi:hypothetical protein
MQLFASNDSYTFFFNGVKFVKNFMVIKQGATNISIHNAYDTQYQLLGSTHFSQVSVNDNVYSTQSALMSALSTVLFAKQIVDFNVSGLTQNLQSVTNLGNSTTNSIDVSDSTGNVLISPDGSITAANADGDNSLIYPFAIQLNNASSGGQITLNATDGTIRTNGSAIYPPASPSDYQLPEQSGVIALLTDIPVFTGITAPNLQEVTDSGNETINSLVITSDTGINVNSPSNGQFLNIQPNYIILNNADVTTRTWISNHNIYFTENHAGTGGVSFEKNFSAGTGTNSTQTYSLPDKVTGEYILATLDDIPTPITNIRVTGGTYSNGTAVFTNSTGGTFNVTGFYTGATNVNITGATYNASAGTATFANSTGGTFNLTGITSNLTTVILNDCIDSATVSGTTSNTLLKSYLIPAGTFAAGDKIDINTLFIKTTTNGSSTFVLSVNTTNSLAGATKIAGYNGGGAGNKYYNGFRSLSFKSSSSFNIFTTAANNGFDYGIDNSSESSISFNTAVDNYLFASVIPSSSSDIQYLSRISITRLKAKTTI